MNPLTREWVDKAEGDFAPAARELRARKSPNYDAANEAAGYVSSRRGMKGGCS